MNWRRVWKEKRSRLRRLSRGTNRGKWLVRISGLVMAALVAGAVGMVILFAWYAKDLPNPDRIVRREGFATKLYDRGGQLLYDVFSEKKRTPVNLDQVPLTLRQATIAIEDKNFYKHQGFDPFGITRAIVKTIVFRRLEGGSTLTQQLVKTTLLDPRRTLTRKLKEFILTLQVERKYSKDEILQMYLNEAPYGGTAWGVEAAAETYFGKPVSEVNLAQAAILAGLPQSPTRYSPFAGELYKARAGEVLRRMREDGYINREEETAAQKEVAEVKLATGSGILKAPHFVFYVKQQLVERYGERVVEQGGLRVTTTLDWDLQEAAQKAVTEEVEKIKHLKVSNGAAVVMEPSSGQILAMVGSKNWEDPDYDGKYNVALASRQPGSAIKPVTYLTALKQGYTAATLLMDTRSVFPGGDKPEYTPENYDGKFRGPVLVREALGNSLNVPAVKMLSRVGVKEVLKTGYELGLTTLKPTKEMLARVGLSLTLGGGEVRLLDLATSYSVFANTGKKVEPVSVMKVTDSDGKVLEEWKPESGGRQIISAGEAFIITSILSDNQARSITFGTRSQLDIPDRTVAVKTGTTNDKRDNWTVGWTPQVMVGVWVGNNDNSAMREVASGITGASPIWRRIIMAALKGKPHEEFTKPPEIIEMEVDQISGYPAHDGFPAKKEIFLKGTEPSGDDPVHKKIKVCKGEGKLATPADIGGGNYEEKEAFYFSEADPFADYWKGANKWQDGIDKWLSEQADPKYHPPTDFCGSTNPLWITVISPADKSQTGSDVEVKIEISDIHPVKKVEVYLDGTLKQTFTGGGSPWEITLPDVTDGDHKIDIKA
ncbi:hypothetical protein A2576_02645, partial [Candidatus Amesbacteria bacterium RIFOXYD1_FULL_47_9]